MPNIKLQFYNKADELVHTAEQELYRCALAEQTDMQINIALIRGNVSDDIKRQIAYVVFPELGSNSRISVDGSKYVEHRQDDAPQAPQEPLPEP